MEESKLKVVVVGTYTYIGKLHVYTDEILQLKDALQLFFNPVSNQVSIVPPLFGTHELLKILNPTNVLMYDADDKISEQYEKALTTYKHGIVPAKTIPYPQVQTTLKQTKVK